MKTRRTLIAAVAAALLAPATAHDLRVARGEHLESMGLRLYVGPERALKTLQQAIDLIPYCAYERVEICLDTYYDPGTMGRLTLPNHVSIRGKPPLVMDPIEATT